MGILKKIFFLSLFLFVFSGMLWGVYNLSFKDAQKTADLPAEKEEEKIASGEKTSPDQKSGEKSSEDLAVVVDEAVVSPTISSSGNGLAYFKKKDGQAYESDLFGKEEKNLTNRDNLGLEKAFWSVDKKKAVLKIKGQDGNVSFVHHDFLNDTDKKIKDNVDEVSWQTNANRIFYKYFDPATKGRTLNISDPDGSNWKLLADIPYRKVSISQIPKTGEVSFWNTGDAYEQTLLATVPMSGGEARTVFRDSFGADYLWNVSGEKAIVSSSDKKGGNKIQLGIINANGGEYRNLNIPTFVFKCVWSKDGKTLYYALPGGIPDNSVLPNDYANAKFQTTDTFWKIDTETGEKARIIEIENISVRADAEDMFLDQGESVLFFRNRIDQKLYRINL